MRALSIVHQADAGPGVFAGVLAQRGWEVQTWTPPTQVPPDLDGRVDAVLVYGGAMNVDEELSHPWLEGEKALLRGLIGAKVPLLGVCLGSQLVAEAAGAAPRRASEPEIGWHPVELTDEAGDDPVLGGLDRRFEAFQWHSYEAPLPPGASALAHSPVCLQAYRLPGPTWGIQFHAEVSLAGAERWLDDFRSDPDAVRTGLDPEPLRAATRERIGDWNRLGADLCGRFLDEAARSSRSG